MTTQKLLGNMAGSPANQAGSIFMFKNVLTYIKVDINKSRCYNFNCMQVQIYGKDGLHMVSKSPMNLEPDEALKVAEEFFERFGLTEQIQQFLKADETQLFIDKTFEMLDQKLQASKNNVPPERTKRSEELYKEYLGKVSTLRQDAVDNLKRSIYVALSLYYNSVGNDDERFKTALEKSGAIGNEMLMVALQEVCKSVSGMAFACFSGKYFQ